MSGLAFFYFTNGRLICKRRTFTFKVDGSLYTWENGADSPGKIFIDAPKPWRCVLTSLDRTRATSLDESPKSPIAPEPRVGTSESVIARFVPPQHGRGQGEFILFTATHHVVALLISALLLVSKPDDWKYSQSAIPPGQLQAMLRSDISGDLPPYAAFGPQPELSTKLHTTVIGNSRWS